MMISPSSNFYLERKKELKPSMSGEYKYVLKNGKPIPSLLLDLIWTGYKTGLANPFVVKSKTKHSFV